MSLLCLFEKKVLKSIYMLKFLGQIVALVSKVQSDAMQGPVS